MLLEENAAYRQMDLLISLWLGKDEPNDLHIAKPLTMHSLNPGAEMEDLLHN